MKHLLAFPLFLFLVAAIAQASPILIDLGPNRVMTSVSRNADGAVYLVGHEVNPETLVQTGLLVSIATDQTVSVQNLRAPPGPNSLYITHIRGDYIVGHSLQGLTLQGLAWTVDDPGTPIPIEPIFVNGAGDTYVEGVNSHGQYSGTTASARVPMTGQVGGETIALNTPNELGVGWAVSENGTVVGERTSDEANGILAIVWGTDESVQVLQNPFVYSGDLSQIAFAKSIAPNDSLLGGFVGIFDEITERIREAAVIWSGEGWSELTVLTDQDGNTLWGEVLGVTDNGYAVGQSSIGGFIWHTSWSYAQLFNSWALGEFGISIPTWVTSVNDVFWDGVNLNFALEGSAYFLSAPVGESPVPEPAGLLLLAIGTLSYFRARLRSRNVGADGTPSC